MDLHLMDALPTADERAAIDEVLGSPASGRVGDGHVAFGGHEARAQRHLLLPTLHAIQTRVGWVSRGALNYVSQRLDVPPAEAYGVASFYGMLALEERPARVVHVCDDLACRLNGGREVAERFAAAGGEGERWVRSNCLGLCERAPAALFQTSGVEPAGRAVAPISDAVVDGIVSGNGWFEYPGEPTGAPQTEPARRDPALTLLRRVGAVDASSLDDYRAHGGYEALRIAVGLGPEGVIRELEDAKLLGRGGAAFPTGVKWKAVAEQMVRPHYFVCNADESEPGTFKDRVVMESDPYAVVESLTIAGYATGSEKGYLYIRGEYPLATARIEHAIAEARARGFLGGDVMGEGFVFDVELRRGAGAYIAGEETALFNSIEGKRPEPRNKPPFPVTHGLFGKPTGINNVETLINVLEILRVGGPAYALTGTPDSTGTRLFCLSGHVERPGVYEVECGTPLRDLLDLAGGVRGGRPLQAVLLGGAAGAFVTPDELDVPLSFEGARDAGVTLGSGVVMVFDDTVDLRDVLLRIAAFFRDESCGQCVPCRVGTVRQEEALHRLAGNGHAPTTDLALLGELGQVMRDASICGLGQTAANAIASAVAKFGLFGGRSAS
jgi:NADH-quinone oxidoreductase subunit F